MTELNTCEIRRKAAAIMQERGKANRIMNAEGQVCLLGAIGLAVGLPVPEDIRTYDTDPFYEDPRIIEVLRTMKPGFMEKNAEHADDVDMVCDAYHFSDNNTQEDVVYLLLEGCDGN